MSKIESDNDDSDNDIGVYDYNSDEAPNIFLFLIMAIQIKNL